MTSDTGAQSGTDKYTDVGALFFWRSADYFMVPAVRQGNYFQLSGTLPKGFMLYFFPIYDRVAGHQLGARVKKIPVDLTGKGYNVLSTGTMLWLPRRAGGVIWYCHVSFPGCSCCLLIVIAHKHFVK
jgi:hypothetical protein